MWIEWIRVERFVIFDQREFKFSRGFNLVLAPNEAGKSTLFRAILMLLYSSARSSSRRLKDFRMWGEDRMYRIEGLVHLDSGSYRIVKDFEEKSQELLDYTSGRRVATGREVDGFLKDRLIFPSEELFLRVCAVRHEELQGVTGGSMRMGERIERILGGGWGESSPDDVARALSKYRAELVRGEETRADEVNWGPLKRLKVEVSELERKIEEAGESARRERTLRGELSRLEEEISTLKREMDIATERLERAGRWVELSEEMERTSRESLDIQRKLMRVDELMDELSESERIGKKFPGDLSELEGDELAEHVLLLRREKELEEKVESPASGGNVIVRHPSVSVVLSAALMIAGWIFRGWSPFFWMAVLAGFLMILFTAWAYASSRERRELSVELRELRKSRRSWSSRLSAEEALELVDEVMAWRNECERCAVRVDELLMGEGLDSNGLRSGSGADFTRSAIERLKELKYRLTDRFSALALDIQGMKERLEELKPFELDGDEVIRTEKELEARRERLGNLEEKRRKIEIELSSLQRFDVVSISERLELKRKALQKVRKRLKAVEAAIEALEEARKGFAGFLSRELPPIVSGFIYRVTGGRYSEIRMDPVSLKTTVVVGKGFSAAGSGDVVIEVDPESLSRGTRDQLYLGLRLGLVKLLGRKESLPVILDDPLVHFDPERRSVAMRLLEEMASEHQILFFSCDLERRFPDAYRVDI